MKIIDLEQGSEEWIKYRSTRIGATDFAVIAANAGLCPNIYRKSLKGIAKDKKLPSIINLEQQNIFDEGHIWENLHRDRINAYSANCYENKYLPLIIAHDNNKLFASLDGYAKSTYIPILEIKSITERRTNFDGLLNYWCYQIMHQLYISRDHRANLLVVQGGYIFGNYILKKQSFEDDLFELLNKDDNTNIGHFNLSELDWLLMCEDFIDNYLKE